MSANVLTWERGLEMSMRLSWLDLRGAKALALGVLLALSGFAIGCGSDGEAGASGQGDEPMAGDKAPSPDEKDGEGKKEQGLGSISSPSTVAPDTMSHEADKDGNYPDLRGGCNINSGYADDEACIPPPPPEEGFQIHVGPKDYDDPAEVAKFLMEPGGESSECWTFHMPNDEEITYQSFVLSGRAGTHHIINTMFTDAANLEDGGFSQCADPGVGTNPNIVDNLPGASKPYMARGHVALEDKNIGRRIPAHAAAQADMHYFNVTDKPIIREFWMNIYYSKNEVTKVADQIRGMGGLGWNANPIPPGADEVYKYECPISGDGRILALLGHYHSQGVRFTAHIRRGGEMNKVFEMYDYRDPATFEYNSLIENPEFSETAAGAVSGVLNVSDGDVLMWECHIKNDLDRGLRYTNNVVGGEMCNIWGSSIGIEPINCLIP